MTQDEVDLIYAYLHEKYRYHDGFLIRKDGTRVNGSQMRGSNKFLLEMCIRCAGKKYHWSYSHAIYFYHHKKKPKYIDHINGNPVDNKIENLKEVSMSSRVMGESSCTNNKHGFRGVIKDGNKFYARIMINKKYKWISSHASAEEAHQAYLKAKEQYKNA